MRSVDKGCKFYLVLDNSPGNCCAKKMYVIDLYIYIYLYIKCAHVYIYMYVYIYILIYIRNDKNTVVLR